MSGLYQELHRLRVAVMTALRRPPQVAVPNAGSKEPELLSSAAIQTYTAVVAALLYFAGWMFLYYYLLDFGIDIFSLDIPFYYFFVYSFATFTFCWARWAWAIVLIGLLGPIVIVLSHVLMAAAKTSGRQVFRCLAGTLIVFGIGGSFFFGHAGAQRAADWNYKKHRFAPAFSYEFRFRGQVDLSTDTSLSPLTLPYIDEKKVVRAIPIIETKDRYFVLVQPALRGISDPRARLRARVVEINRTDVLFAKVVIEDERLACDEAAELGLSIPACH